MMAKVAVQPSGLFVVNMIETDRLIDRLTPQNRENGKNERFRRNPKAMPSDRSKKKHQDDRREKEDFLLHSFSLFASLQICQSEIAADASSLQSELSNLSTERREITRTA
jgi:hypothetical protein